MRQWPVQDVQVHFSELLEATAKEGPQVVTKGGAETFVIVSIEEWRRLTKAAGLSLKDFLLAPDPRFELDIPPRGNLRLRPPPDFD
jgi:prevent-host-death family protein